jgi:hypothetical protein
MTITKTQQIEITRKIFKILGGEKNVYNLHFYWNKGDGLEFYTGSKSSVIINVVMPFSKSPI